MNRLLDFRKPLILASASPRRRQLLGQLKLEFEVRVARIDEENLARGLQPRDYVMKLAQSKAAAIARDAGDAWVIGADTIVVLDGDIINKPADAAEACAMLRRLSGRTHQVYSGFAIIDAATGATLTDYRRTDVEFRELDEDEISDYVAGGSPLDKAGAYGIQDDFGAVFVREVRGCYYNVVGLPLELLYRRLRECLTTGIAAE